MLWEWKSRFNIAITYSGGVEDPTAKVASFLWKKTACWHAPSSKIQSLSITYSARVGLIAAFTLRSRRPLFLYDAVALLSYYFFISQ